MKKCSRCKQIQDFDNFHKESQSKNKYASYCKQCKKEYASENKNKLQSADLKYRSLNKEKIALRKRSYYYSNQEKEIARVKKYNSNHKLKIADYKKQRNKTVKGKFSQYKGNAKKRGLEWKLLFIEFNTMVNKNCYYCGSQPNPLNGIDRLNNDLPYIIENCVSCCTVCNYMKRNYSEEYFLSKIEQIYLYRLSN